MNSDMVLRWYHGGRKVSSPTNHLGGKMTKSAIAVPWTGDGAERTVKIEGSGWSKEMEPMVLNLPRSYLYG